MDANPDALKAVEEGGIYMTIALPPYEIGRIGVQFAQQILQGGTFPSRRSWNKLRDQRKCRPVQEVIRTKAHKGNSAAHAGRRDPRPPRRLPPPSR
jgi:ABC-type sugar transport system substrate-binding protein